MNTSSSKQPTQKEKISADNLSWKEAYTKGYEEFKKGNYERARKYHLIVQEKSPGHVNSLINLGMAELRIDSIDKSKALERFKTALQIDPDNELASKLLSKHKK